jgi:hypothetical protein
VQDLPAPAGQPNIGEMTLLNIDYGKLADSVGAVRDRFNSIIGTSN